MKPAAHREQIHSLPSCMWPFPSSLKQTSCFQNEFHRHYEESTSMLRPFLASILCFMTGNGECEFRLWLRDPTKPWVPLLSLYYSFHILRPRKYPYFKTHLFSVSVMRLSCRLDNEGIGVCSSAEAETMAHSTYNLMDIGGSFNDDKASGTWS